MGGEKNIILVAFQYEWCFPAESVQLQLIKCKKLKLIKSLIYTDDVKRSVEFSACSGIWKCHNGCNFRFQFATKRD